MSELAVLVDGVQLLEAEELASCTAPENARVLPSRRLPVC